MSLPKHYDPGRVEPRLQTIWQESGVYHFSPDGKGPAYSIDTPPPTVSGHLHVGHLYSYTHTDVMARFWRMNGRNVFYPMGYDDNGLPTERLVERRFGITAGQVGRKAFIEKCLEVSEQIEQECEALWRRLGLSIDWRYTYRTIGELSRSTSQYSFLDLYRKGLVYRRQAPSIWCPECGTAIAQAELADLERESEFATIAFGLDTGETLAIATTRPELLPACVAVFVHPEDQRFRHLVGQQVTVPLFGHLVPVLLDPAAEPEKGTGAVMCCTFGDITDVEWWYIHQLPLREVIGRDGRLTLAAGSFAGLSVPEARQGIAAALQERGLLLGRQLISQSVRVHERCDTPVEYIVTPQWFVRVLAFRDKFLEAGDRVIWHPAHMRERYREWVENLRWDWCISRQRYFGVPFPVWYCDTCGRAILAGEQQLPVDPADVKPVGPCDCGGTTFTPETDVMDTWATSSLTPQIVGRWLAGKALYNQVFPMSLRPQAHEIIRTWAFYTIVKSYHHFGAVPWREVAISGWVLVPGGTGKISKSRGGGPMAPMEMLERYSADAVRYWATSTGLGKDAVISEEKIQAGAKLATKLWNVARFSERFLENYTPPAEHPALSPADRWILSRSQTLIRRATELLRNYEHAVAKSEIENFFWNDLADNYLEMSKRRLYDGPDQSRAGARYALWHALLAAVKLFAPFLPHVTEEIYQLLFASAQGGGSLHNTNWPAPVEVLEDHTAEAAGDALVGIATAVRRYKSDRSLPMDTELERLQLATADPALASLLLEAESDLMSITRARQVELVERAGPDLTIVKADGAVTAAVADV